MLWRESRSPWERLGVPTSGQEKPGAGFSAEFVIDKEQPIENTSGKQAGKVLSTKASSKASQGRGWRAEKPRKSHVWEERERGFDCIWSSGSGSESLRREVSLSGLLAGRPRSV